MNVARLMASTFVIVMSLAQACLAQGQGGSQDPAGKPDWPKKPIRMIVGFGAGGGTDIVGRIMAQGLQDRLGQSVVVENRPGAAGTTGNEAVARADKDGTTLGVMTAGQIIAAVMSKSLRYDPIKAFDPVSLVGTASLVIATRADFAAGSVKELIAEAKAEPGKFIFASPGFGATQHLSAELFMQTAGIRMVHVPFRSSPEMITAVLGGQVHVMFDTVSAVIAQVQSGDLKALAVTGKDRFPALPDVPAAIEAGVMPGYDVTTWYGLFGPSGMPADVLARLNAVTNELLRDAAVARKLVGVGLVVQGSTSEGFGSFMAREFDRWTAVRVAAALQQN